jgi:hypothetical protein
MGNNGRDGKEPTSSVDDPMDWDVKINVPPPRPEQTLLVRFVEGGRWPVQISGDPQD